ncbi:hypothetical protein [Pseudoalteromonas luteoviolacea]|uniref:Uncharacterized protein n=1 Tax=Pseudoalteromonas luteoviolacea S4060-1 TaxID=1365257 RepID=A0A167K8U2_9GAMM|nr:hypothetical protein [Pseudoalteromonas luteoviolacea]KZN62305.1 hypothetical protein N478_25475 [Pseudoalteromonas luteoviolacea S4060-1]
MYTFQQYLSLDKCPKSLATQFWYTSIKEYLNAKSAYDVKKQVLSAHYETSVSSELMNHKSDFFKQKEKGQPVIREQIVDNIDMCLAANKPFKSILCHPFWQLINCNTPSCQTVTAILANLPYHFASLILKEDTYGNEMIKEKLHKKTQDKLFYELNLNGLTYWIAVSHYLPKTALKMHSQTLQLMAVQYLIKLSVISPLNAITEQLTQYLTFSLANQKSIDTELYPNIYLNLVDQKGLHQLPLPNSIVQQPSNSIRNTILIYELLTKKAIELNLIRDNTSSKTLFLNFICFSELPLLVHFLFDHPTPPKSLAELKRQILEVL